MSTHPNLGEAPDGGREPRPARRVGAFRLAWIGAALIVLVGSVGLWTLRSPERRNWLKYGYDQLTTEAPRAMPAADVDLHYPAGLAGSPNGTVYISERLGHRIWRLKDGELKLIAGTGRLGASPEGVPADRARVYFPEGLDVHPDGGIVFADSWNHRVRTIDAEGRIWTIAGDGNPGNRGDSGPALEAQLLRPFDVAVQSDGAVLIVDWGNHCIRRVDSLGMISTFAGRCGSLGFSGDGGPAVEANLDEPYGIDIGPNGDVYIADSRNDRIRRVTTDGRIDTVAGRGTTGFSGDGGLAIQAELNNPQAIFALADGGLIIDDEHNNRIRRVDANGRIETILGRGERGFAGDGGAATKALIDDPEDVWQATGGLYVTDGANGVLRFVDLLDRASTVAGQVPQPPENAP